MTLPLGDASGSVASSKRSKEGAPQPKKFQKITAKESNLQFENRLFNSTVI